MGKALTAETDAIVKRAPEVANKMIDQLVQVLESPVPMSDPRACIEKGRFILELMQSGIFMALPSRETDKAVVEDFAGLAAKVQRATDSAAVMKKELARRAAAN